MSMLTRRTFLLGAVLSVLAAATPHQAVAAVIDQRGGCGDTGSYAVASESAPLGQEFIPTISDHVGVILWFGSTGGQEVDLTIRLREGTIDGEVVPGSVVSQTFVFLRDPWRPGQFYLGWPPDAPADFMFDDVVRLSTGSTYVIELECPQDVWWSTVYWPWARAGNRAIINALPQEDEQFTFNTVVVPEPCSAMLLLAGVIVPWRMGGRPKRC